MSSSKRHIYIKQFWQTAFISFALGIMATAMLCYFVDPYGITESIRITDFNAAKIRSMTHARLYKTEHIRHAPAKILFLGLSRVERGLPPSALDEPNTFNMAVHSADIVQLERLTRHAIATDNGTLEEIIVGLDFRMFDETRKPEIHKEEWCFAPEETNLMAWLQCRLFVWKSILLTVDALSDSIKTIFAQKTLAQSAFHNPQGLLVYNVGKRDAKRIGQFQIFSDVLQGYSEQFTQEMKLPKSFDDGRQGQALKNLLTLAEQHHIKVRLLINPLHYWQYVMYQRTGYWQDFWRWKTWLIKTAAKSELWDFSLAPMVSAEPVPLPKDKDSFMQNYYDPSHYRPVLGKAMLRQIYYAKAGFGVRINNADMPALKIKMENRIRAYRQAHNTTETMLFHD